MNGAHPWLGSGNTQLSLAKHDSVLDVCQPQKPVPAAQSIAQLDLHALHVEEAESRGVVLGLFPSAAQSIAQRGPHGGIALGVGGSQGRPWLRETPAQLIAQPHQPLSPAVLAYLQAALSDNTRRAYQQDIQDFVAWGGRVPCSAETLTAYLADRAESLSAHTLQRRLVGIGRAHATQGWPNPCKCELVRAVMHGIRRSKGVAQRQCDPILKDHLPALLECMQGFRGVRDRALVLVGFAAALRRSELAALQVGDIERVEGGLVVRLSRSKTDQVGAGRRIAVPTGRTNTCPVKAYESWLHSSGIQHGAVFRAISRSGGLSTHAISAQSIALILKDYATKAGLSAPNISGHSLRAGLVTSAILAGVPTHKIQEQTGHKSLVMLSRYIRDARLFDGNAAGGVL